MDEAETPIMRRFRPPLRLAAKRVKNATDRSVGHVAFLLPGTGELGTVRNILLTQFAIAGALAGVVWLGWGAERAIPTLLGGLIAVVPNAFLAARVMSPRAGQSAKGLLRAGWLGEIGKLGIAAVMFAAVFMSLRPLHPGYLFTGYIATLLALPLGLLFDGKKREG
jgi:ATP synthase protein I